MISLRGPISSSAQQFSALDALQLLRAYQWVLSKRPLSMGNLDFAASLLHSSRVLAERARPLARHAGVAGQLDAVGAQTMDNFRSSAPRVLDHLDGLLTQLAPPTREEYYLRGPLPALTDDYSELIVVFGPCIGLGDEIGFLPLVRQLARHLRRARLTIFSLYPNLWRELVPQASAMHYRSRPTRPFEHLAVNSRRGTKRLVLIADYEFFDIHDKVLHPGPDDDVVEISLAWLTAWVHLANSDWRWLETFNDLPLRSHYWFVWRIAQRLTGKEPSATPWEPIRRRRRESAKAILVNPLSSKPLPLAPGDWARLVRSSVPRQSEVVVFPGIDMPSHTYVGEIIRLLRSYGLRARSLDSEVAPITAFTAIPRLSHALPAIGLCITLDTFTAHLVPLYGISTVVITYGENREFWVPSPWAFYVRLGSYQSQVPALALRLASGAVLDHANGLGMLCSHLRQATEAASATPTRETVTSMLASLTVLLSGLQPDYPCLSEGAAWRAVWSRVATAVVRQPVSPAAIAPHFERWKESNFYKLVYDVTRRAHAT